MKVKHYDDIDYSIIVPEDVYVYFLDEAKRLSFFGSNGLSALRHEIERAHFRYITFGRKPETEMEIVARTMVAEEV